MLSAIVKIVVQFISSSFHSVACAKRILSKPKTVCCKPTQIKSSVNSCLRSKASLIFIAMFNQKPYNHALLSDSLAALALRKARRYMQERTSRPEVSKLHSWWGRVPYFRKWVVCITGTLVVGWIASYPIFRQGHLLSQQKHLLQPIQYPGVSKYDPLTYNTHNHAGHRVLYYLHRPFHLIDSRLTGIEIINNGFKHD